MHFGIDWFYLFIYLPFCRELGGGEGDLKSVKLNFRVLKMLMFSHHLKKEELIRQSSMWSCFLIRQRFFFLCYVQASEVERKCIESSFWDWKSLPFVRHMETIQKSSRYVTPFEFWRNPVAKKKKKNLVLLTKEI